MPDHAIVNTEVSQHEVAIKLQNGVVLRVYSEEGHFYFTVGRIESPTLWGYTKETARQSNNVHNCFYEVSR